MLGSRDERATGVAHGQRGARGGGRHHGGEEVEVGALGEGALEEGPVGGGQFAHLVALGGRDLLADEAVDLQVEDAGGEAVALGLQGGELDAGLVALGGDGGELAQGGVRGGACLGDLRVLLGERRGLDGGGDGF